MSREKRSSHALAVLVAALFVAVLLAILFHGGEDPAAAPDEASTEAVLDPLVAAPPPGIREREAHLEGERRRIQEHLLEVEAELSSREVDGLAPDARTNRARHLRVLREYAQRGEFPRNLDFPGERVPYFVDDRGVHCAVGYLIHRDGRDDLVYRIASARNNARIAELADDPALVAWLEEAGLSAAEAARIQPAYCGRTAGADPSWCPPPPAQEPKGGVSGRYWTASLATGALSGFSAGLALSNGPAATSRWTAALGATSGMVGLGLGAYGIGEGGDARKVGALNAALGAVSTYLGLRSLLAEPHSGPGRPGFEEQENGSEHRRPTISVSPLLAADREEGQRAGVAVTIRR